MNYVIRNKSKTIINIFILCLCLISSSIKVEIIKEVDTFYMENKYIEIVLDAIRFEESQNGKYRLNINRDENGKELSRDEGDYQLNSSCRMIFMNAYNDGIPYDPYNNKVARKIAKALIMDNFNYTKSMFDSVVAYNCGIKAWSIKAPHNSYLYATRVFKRVKKLQTAFNRI